jgi:hypothetical protein
MKEYVGQCAVCGKSHGYFQRATYEGAPDGGVTVHGSCLAKFYKELEEKQWQEDMNDAYIAAKV